jgi:hypothetical protein
MIMAERLKNSGFWTFRFLIAPEEFHAWIADVAKSMDVFQPFRETGARISNSRQQTGVD